MDTIPIFNDISTNRSLSLAPLIPLAHAERCRMDPPAPPSAAAPPARILWLAVIVIASVSTYAIALLTGHVRPDTIQTLVADGGPSAMAVYVLAVIIAELLWFPRMWGLLAGGILFGPVLGAVLSILGDSMAAVLCYFIARGTGRAWVSAQLEKKPSARRGVHILAERRGAVTIALLRVCPIAHYTLVSYGAGVAGVSPRSFLLGSTIGIIPGAIVYPIVGDAALRPTSPMFLGSLAVVLVFLVVTLVAARRTFKP